MHNRLRRARLLAGITKAELARLARVDASYVTRMEQGVPNPGTERLLRVAGALGLSLDWLVSGEGEGPTEDSVRAAMSLARVATNSEQPATDDTAA